MKRDMDLIRSLLLKIEEQHDGGGGGIEIEGVDSPPDIVTEHLFMLADVGMIEARNASHFGGREIIVLRMTWTGYDFLDSIRDDEIWKKTKAGAGAAGGFTVDLLKDLAKGLIKKKSRNTLELKSELVG